MNQFHRRLITGVTAVLFIALGIAVTAGPASAAPAPTVSTVSAAAGQPSDMRPAAFTDCHINFVCLFTGSNGTGSLWGVDGTDLSNCHCAVQVPSGFTRSLSFNNNTLGTACLYNTNLTIVTDTLRRQTHGNLSNSVTDWVAICG